MYIHLTSKNHTWKLSQGDPGRRLMPPGGSPTTWANSLVLLQVLGSVPFWQANSQSFRLSIFGIIWLVKKHSVRFHSRQIEPVHSPLIHNCVPSLQRVLFFLAAGCGQSGVRPLQVELQLQSDSALHWTLDDSNTKLHVSLEQQGPWLGLKLNTHYLAGYNHFLPKKSGNERLFYLTFKLGAKIIYVFHIYLKLILSKWPQWA